MSDYSTLIEVTGPLTHPILLIESSDVAKLDDLVISARNRVELAEEKFFVFGSLERVTRGEIVCP